METILKNTLFLFFVDSIYGGNGKKSRQLVTMELDYICIGVHLVLVLWVHNISGDRLAACFDREIFLCTWNISNNLDR